jgi:hypothetical protein
MFTQGLGQTRERFPVRLAVPQAVPLRGRAVHQHGRLVPIHPSPPGERYPRLVEVEPVHPHRRDRIDVAPPLEQLGRVVRHRAEEAPPLHTVNPAGRRRRRVLDLVTHTNQRTPPREAALRSS